MQKEASLLLENKKGRNIFIGGCRMKHNFNWRMQKEKRFIFEDAKEKIYLLKVAKD